MLPYPSPSTAHFLGCTCTCCTKAVTAIRCTGCLCGFLACIIIMFTAISRTLWGALFQLIMRWFPLWFTFLLACNLILFKLNLALQILFRLHWCAVKDNRTQSDTWQSHLGPLEQSVALHKDRWLIYMQINLATQLVCTHQRQQGRCTHNRSDCLPPYCAIVRTLPAPKSIDWRRILLISYNS